MTAGAQRRNNVVSTLIQRVDVDSTFDRRCFNVVCPLGTFTFPDFFTLPFWFVDRPRMCLGMLVFLFVFLLYFVLFL